MFETENRVFTFTIATDIERDSFGVELEELVEGKSVYLASLMRNDTKKIVEFISESIDVPFAVIKKLESVFDSEIPKEYFE